MGMRLGMEAKLYRNTGTYAVPVWAEIANVKDVTLNLEKGEADVTTRANKGWRAKVGTLKEGSIEFEMVWDTGDPGFEAVKDAYFDDEPIELAVLDGDVTTSGTQGLRALFSVTSFSRKEPLEEAMSVAVAMKVTYSAHPPEWMDVA
jgi:TP901-1 family phage major tail protein